jgi:hypothetical protein
MIPFTIFKSLDVVEEILKYTDDFLDKNSPFEFLNALIVGEFDSKFFSPDNLLVDTRGLQYPKFTNPKSELDCAIKLHESLKLNPLSANDPRVWTYACLRVYPKYIIGRNSLDDSLNKEMFYRYFFFKGSSATTNARNTISKLWWSVNQTIDEELEDKYKYTKLLYRGKYSQVFQDVTQRPLIFSNRIILKAYLEFMENKQGNTSKIIAPLVLNHVKSYNLYHMGVDDVIMLLENIFEDIKFKGLV